MPVARKLAPALQANGTAHLGAVPSAPLRLPRSRLSTVPLFCLKDAWCKTPVLSVYRGCGPGDNSRHAGFTSLT